MSFKNNTECDVNHLKGTTYQTPYGRMQSRENAIKSEKALARTAEKNEHKKSIQLNIMECY